MKILYLTTETQDYLSDSLLIGLKENNSVEIFEYPGNKFIYHIPELSQDFISNNYYGRGFTLYNKLNKDLQKTINNLDNIDFYDFVVFSSIYNQYNIYKKIKNLVNSNKIIIVDGDDSPALFPFNGKFIKWYNFFSFHILHRKHKYFKRELNLETVFTRFYKLIPRNFLKYKYLGNNVYPISFSIPKILINKTFPSKFKDFTSHIVDPDISKLINNLDTSYKFNYENDYYNDILISKFGITTKKGGWDCLRHYEIAANAALLCFKDLHLKDNLCAPHDLIPNYNCISYENYTDLIEQLSNLNEEKYNQMILNSIDWIESKCCDNVANLFIKEITNCE
jgi:hypothetical protein